MIIIGFYKGHNATACILKDGQILAAVSEERFNRIKNADVFPKEAISYCLSKVGITAQEVDLYVRIYEHPEGYVNSKGQTKNSRLMDFVLYPANFLKRITYLFPSLGFAIKDTYSFLSQNILAPIFQQQFKVGMAKYLNIDSKKIVFANHHLCHAFAGFYGFVSEKEQKKKHLVVTVDGEGDGLCSSIWVVEKDEWKQIAKTAGGNSIATFYGLITSFLGMKMNEHEYKVMGLAPYVSAHETDKIYPLFKDLFSVDDNLVIHSKYPSGSYLYYFDKVLLHQRFDGIAAAAQLLVEDLVTELVRKAIKKTGIKNVVVSGGLFMNVKANKRLAELAEIENLIVCPSSGDESAPFGGAYWGYKQLSSSNFLPKNISNLYLGSIFDDKDIEKTIRDKKLSNEYSIRKYDDIEKEVAKLLAIGKIVGRFKGRMEWGARALGNRSILMDPSRVDLKQELNDQVKSRDFWMPFAATILDTKEKEYIINPKSIGASYMAIGFDTTEKGRDNLAAAIHPADFTCRPQILKREDNPDYYKLIKYFEGLTGIGAVLNTSFNYHGEPIVCSPRDALHTFKLTGLKHLALGNYLISKK